MNYKFNTFMQKLTLSISLLALSICMVQAVDYVHINEIMYDSPLNEVITMPPYSNGEYIELYNAGYQSTDLTGWKLLGDGSTEIYEFDSVLIPSQSFLIVAYQHSRTPDFELSEVFPAMHTRSGEIIYQNKITLKNTKEYIRLYDAAGVLRDSVYYGNETSIKPISDRLIATNEDGISGSECLSVQRIFARFNSNGSLAANHLDWEVDLSRPFALSSAYIEPIATPRITYAYDLAGNRISRTIELSLSASSRNMRSMKNEHVDEEDPFTEQLENYQIKIYPNPVKELLTVEIKGEDNDADVYLRLYNIQGILLQEVKSTQGVIQQVNMSAYPQATYILRLHTGARVVDYKIIKQ
jgi:hypothetical protein